MKKVTVIGAGPAGMMAAITAAKSGAQVVLVEKNEKLGKKLYITGKGRCNLTNACGPAEFLNNVVTNKKFLYSAAYSFTSADVCAFFEEAGLRLKTERGNRVFPESDKSSDVIKTLADVLKRLNVKVILNAQVTGITLPRADGAKCDNREHGTGGTNGILHKNMPEESDVRHIKNGGRESLPDCKSIKNEESDVRCIRNDGFKYQSKDSDETPGNKLKISVICQTKSSKQKPAADAQKPEKISMESDAVIIATGGLSYPSTGSTGDGYVFAKELGHDIVKPIPSLTALVVKERHVKDLEGLSLKNISIHITENEKTSPVYEDFGEMLFTDEGLSGPVILSASAFIGRLLDEAAPGTYKLLLDLKPALDAAQLDKRILRDFDEKKNKEFKNVLPGLLPAKLIPVIIKLSGIAPEKKANEIKKTEREALVRLFKAMPFTIEKTGDFSRAVITKGGVDVKKVNPKTMESKLVPGIYFAGEVLDVDAYTGGFNLQTAFCTGYAAGLSAAAFRPR